LLVGEPSTEIDRAAPSTDGHDAADNKASVGLFIFGAGGKWAGHHRQCGARYTRLEEL